LNLNLTPLPTAAVVFVLILAGAALGIVLRVFMPEKHLTSDTKDTVRLACGLLVTMTGLVLGMLVSSAKSYYDGQRNQVANLSAEIISLNAALMAYGPDASGLRAVTHQTVEDAVNRIWPLKANDGLGLRPLGNDAYVFTQIRLLVPRTEAQIADKAQLVALIGGIRKSYWLLFLQSEENSMSVPLLLVVTLWLATIFVSFGVFAPTNPPVVVTLVICALSVSSAFLIILQMYSPFHGPLMISPAALRDALNQMV
jgi:hypothetical protein